MALEKQDISLDLVHGTDTKVNPQIDPGFQDMVNVVFDGEMTAKKMDGYDLVSTLPEGEKFSLLARRQGDLIAQCEQGVYKHLPALNEFRKISEIGSAGVLSDERAGYVFAFGTNYRCYAKFDTGTGQSHLYFTDHNGTVINKIENSSGDIVNRTKKLIAVGDTFYEFCLDGPPTFSVHVLFGRRYNLVGGVYVMDASFSLDLLLADPGGIDYFSDGVNLYVFWSFPTETRYVKFDLALNSLLITPGTIISNRGLEIFSCDANNLYMTISTTGGGATSVLKLVKIRKSDMAEILTTTIMTTSGPTGHPPFFSTYPLSDTTAVCIPHKKFAQFSIDGVRQNFPVGKIFKQDGNYFLPILCYFGNNVCTVVMKIGYYEDDFDPSNNQYYLQCPVAVTDAGGIDYLKVLENYNNVLFVRNDTVLYEEENYFPSITPENSPTMISFGPNAKQRVGAIEIQNGLIISGAIQSYYDGVNFSEHGFIGNPHMFDFSIGASGGSLPADTGYAVVSIYSWKDSFGNIFYSAPSQIYSGFDPVNGITIAANGTINFSLQRSIITAKENFTLEIYIRRKNKPFQLATTYNSTLTTNPVSVNAGIDGIDVLISDYPDSAAKVYPYFDGSIAPEVVSNASFIGLYGDRIFRINKDNPTSLSYSQRKQSGQGFEFNDSFFYLDVLDKRGVFEDNLSACVAMDGRLIIFRETSVLYMNGSGPSRANTQDDFSEPDLIVADVGCTEPRSIVLVPGGVMFKSDKGIYLLNRKLQAGYIGSSVERFNDHTITSAILVEEVNEVRFSTLEGVTLVFNYLSNAWSWFTDMECVSACLYQGKYTVLKTDGSVIQETSAHKKMIDQPIIQTISSPWLRLKKIQGYQKAYYVYLLGDYVSDHKLKMKVFYDYELYSSEEYTITPLDGGLYNITSKPTDSAIETGAAINGVYQMKIDLVRKNCQAIRVVIEDEPLDIENNTGECFALSNITVTIGLKKGAAKIQGSKSY